jgi:hypothetical protein
MFVGHYAASLVLKSVDKKTSLGMLFIGVQFVDILFFPLVLMGIEKFDLVLNHTESTHFDLVFMPYSHSLVATVVWAVIVYLGLRLLLRGASASKNRTALMMALAVASHWFFDLIVHTPDLPLAGDGSLKMGFGLWNNAVATYLLEAALLLVGLGIYLKSTTASTFAGKYGMAIFVVFMLIVNANNIFGPPFGDNVTVLSWIALVMYFLFAGVAFWLDTKRV